MKILLLFVFVILFIAVDSYALEESIYDFLTEVDNDYLIVLGDSAPGSDSLVAIDINNGLAPVSLNASLENEVERINRLILVGNPCYNSLIDFDCDTWSYKNGEALIKIDGSNLIIAGTTANDVRKAGKVISKYKDYDVLKNADELIIKGSLDFPIIEVPKAKEEMVCGDDTCESGEICEIDCRKISCDEICEDEGYVSGSCVDLELENIECAIAKIGKYCSDGRVCCCEIEKDETSNEIIKTEDEEIKEEKIGFFRRLINWLSSLFE